MILALGRGRNYFAISEGRAGRKGRKVQRVSVVHTITFRTNVGENRQSHPHTARGAAQTEADTNHQHALLCTLNTLAHCLSTLTRTTQAPAHNTRRP